MHFESQEPHNFYPTQSELSDFPLQSPISPIQNSFLLTSNLTTSPDLNGGKKYEINHDELSPQSQVLHAYETPENQISKPRVPHQLQMQNPHPSQKYDLPKQINDNAGEKIKEQERFREIQMLKQHLKSKYSNYTDEQLDEIISKFINEYVQKLNQQEEAPFEDDAEEEDMDGEFPDQSRDSLSTNLDWNDGQQVAKYCQKQKRIQEQKDFRPSQYFGAISVDKLEDGIEDSRIDELFSDCFGIQPKPKKKLLKKEQPQANKQKGMQEKAQGQVVGSNNNIQNDQSCKIVLNFYNQFQIMNQENFAKAQQAQLDSAFTQGQAQIPTFQKEEESATILKDKSNKNLKQTTNGCQVLHSESSNSQKQPHKVQQQTDNLKKFMSPQELMKLKHTKQQSENMNQESSDFQKCFFKTDDNRQNLMLSHKGSVSKNYQTQINSPQSQSQINRHLYNQSITSSSNLGLPNQSLSHQLSMGNLTQSLNSDLQKQSSIQSFSKQSYKSILYKQNPNHHSISSQQSIENKPKQMNKLSYLVAKSLPDGQKLDHQDSNLSHLRINSVTTVNSAPKPPHNQSVPLCAKTGRNSNENKNYTQDSFCNEASPKMSPKQTIIQFNGQNIPQSNGFKVGTHTLTLQHANSTFAPNQKVNLQEQDFSTSLAQKSIESFRQAVNGQNQIDNLLSQRGQKSHKTLGRNQSQNFFKTANTLTGVQSFLMSSGEVKGKQSQEGYQKHNLYLDTDGSSTSPRNMILETDVASTQGYTSRPQTAINTGINQYMSNACNLGKPPSKMSKGFLSHNSSAKTLQLASKTMTVNLQSSQTSSRKLNPSHTQSMQNDVYNYPQSTRNANKSQVKFTTKNASLSKERNAKSNERNKMKSSSIKQAVFQESEKASLERKRIQYKNQKVQQETQAKFFSGNQKPAMEIRPQSGRNQASSLTKGKSFATVTDYAKPALQLQDTNQTQRQDSSSRTMMKINKSLDKISQMFLQAPSSQVLSQYPQTTKNATGATKVTEIINQISNYQTMIKKAKLEKENDQHHTARGTRANSRSKVNSSAHSKNRKDTYSSTIYDGAGQAKKTVETYKKYLSSNQNGLHSFK